MNNSEILPKQHIQTRLWTLIPRPSTKIDQFHPTAGLTAFPCFPLQNFAPCSLVDGVVDRNDRFHVRCVRIVTLARHSGKELCFRGVDPVSICGFGYGRYFTLMRKRNRRGGGREETRPAGTCRMIDRTCLSVFGGAVVDGLYLFVVDWTSCCRRR